MTKELKIQFFLRRRNQKRHDIERRNLEAGNHGNLISRAQVQDKNRGYDLN